jgi:predicted tellurium resistance membrane protein TerC
MFSPEVITAFFQVIAIDLVLAGDNAIVIGLAAAGLPAEQRNKAVVIGILAATLLRIGFAAVTVQLLAMVGLLIILYVALDMIFHGGQEVWPYVEKAGILG